MFTADEGVRGGKIIPLKKMADEALEGCDCVKRVYVYKRTGADVPMKSGRDVFLDDVSKILHIIEISAIRRVPDFILIKGECVEFHKPKTTLLLYMYVTFML
jgi:hypothetical protein